MATLVLYGIAYEALMIDTKWTDCDVLMFTNENYSLGKTVQVWTQAQNGTAGMSNYPGANMTAYAMGFAIAEEYASYTSFTEDHLYGNHPILVTNSATNKVDGGWTTLDNMPKATYTILYDANGGSGAPASQTKTYGVDLSLRSIIPTRTGYDFNGWNTKSDGTGISYSAGSEYTENVGTTLYAQWKARNLVNIYNGTNWQKAIPYIYNGTNWQEAQAHIYDGSNWRISGG